MEVPLAELSKLEKLTAPSSSFKSKSPSTSDTLSSLLQSLRQCKDLADSGTLTAQTLDELARTVEGKKKALDDRQKEVYSSVARIGKAMDKVTSSVLLVICNCLLLNARNFPIRCLRIRIFLTRAPPQVPLNEPLQFIF
jgi:hypothetical protein